IQKPVSKQQHVSNSSNPQKSERKEQIISPIKKQLISKAPTIKNEKRHVPAVSSEKPASHDPNKKISLQEYKSFIKEYESTYPKYEELFNKVNKVKEKFTGFKKNALYLKNLSENNQMKEEDISQLEKLKLNVTKESSKVDIKFYDEVNQLKQMHLRLLKVKEYIKG
ncbi:MAG: hypothetical protein MHPSP_003922, partial [Paramarteilia canceri]